MTQSEARQVISKPEWSAFTWHIQNQQVGLLLICLQLFSINERLIAHSLCLWLHFGIPQRVHVVNPVQAIPVTLFQESSHISGSRMNWHKAYFFQPREIVRISVTGHHVSVHAEALKYVSLLMLPTKYWFQIHIHSQIAWRTRHRLSERKKIALF